LGAFTAEDGTQIHYRAWGSGQSEGWPAAVAIDGRGLAG
jgi:hypothetical protein